jgi:hypothetical protein
LTPHTTVVFPTRTSAEPSAVDIEPSFRAIVLVISSLASQVEQTHLRSPKHLSNHPERVHQVETLLLGNVLGMHEDAAAGIWKLGEPPFLLEMILTLR